MVNPGNTGKRYVYRRIVRADVSERGGVTFHLDCGHASAAYEPHTPSRPWDHIWTPEEAQLKIGEQIACLSCGIARHRQSSARE